MNKDFYKGNRERLYAQLQENSLLVLFAGVEVRKTNDEFYPFCHRPLRHPRDWLCGGL